VILTREESRPGTDTLKRHVVSRPLPLEYLRVADARGAGAPQIRRERSELLQLRGDARTTFPLTLWHASAPTARRYTLYAASEAERDKWLGALEHALTVRRAYQDANMVGAARVGRVGPERSRAAPVVRTLDDQRGLLPAAGARSAGACPPALHRQDHLCHVLP
jgi:hypothetical protein